MEAAGFKSYERTGITLNVNDTVRADAALQVGEASESVTVEANAVQVQADSNEVSQTITAAEVADLATNGRNVIQLRGSGAGRRGVHPGFRLRRWRKPKTGSISFNGQRSDHNNWMINGGEAYDRGGGGIMLVSPSQDSLQEFKVMTSNFAADLGQSSGGMITMATKSGTREYHGGAWEYVRNDAFDANTFFANLNGRPKPELRYNTFGFNVGRAGARSAKREKTFFFYNMEWRRLVNGGEINAVAVPRAMTTGDFSSARHGRSKCRRLQDPAEIAKFGQFGLTPGQNFPNNHDSGRSAQSQRHGAFEGRPVPWAEHCHWPLLHQQQQPDQLPRGEHPDRSHRSASKLSLMGSLIYDNGVSRRLPRYGRAARTTRPVQYGRSLLARCGARHLYHQPHPAERGVVQLQRQQPRHHGD